MGVKGGDASVGVGGKGERWKDGGASSSVTFIKDVNVGEESVGVGGRGDNRPTSVLLLARKVVVGEVKLGVEGSENEESKER